MKIDYIVDQCILHVDGCRARVKVVYFFFKTVMTLL